jgi:signal peptidase II
MNIEKPHDKIKFIFLTRESLYIILFGSIIFLSDRISKIKIIDHQLNNNRIYINDFVNFDLVWNTGIGFGIFSTTSYLVYHSITGVIGIVLIFIVYLINKSKFIDKFFFTMILGGALGNFYDRIVYSAVPDFIDMHYQNFHWFTFNIADISISIGVIMLISKDLFFKNEKN